MRWAAARERFGRREPRSTRHDEKRTRITVASHT